MRHANARGGVCVVVGEDRCVAICVLLKFSVAFVGVARIHSQTFYREIELILCVASYVTDVCVCDIGNNKLYF